ncbi:ABC transporter substrate-binding protein [Nocardioides ungokensis]|uniref:ABC transporter substrate-binding protein n=1 Tax=Nocardioides ungokensis TaxID=1643322 RepID=UPI0015DD7E95|nr:ABC transporter substrate-binding protein [Nocardioides ungokensis]
MFMHRKRLIASTAAVALAAALAACGGGGSSSSSNQTAKAGGTLQYYIYQPYDHTDPQRSYLGVLMTNFSRTVYRSLVAFPISTDPKQSFTPVPDLATDTGTSSDGAKVWKFTLKDGIKWQDGKPITCEDFKYGASRIFATDVITGGPTYFLSYLDIPTDTKTGLPAYDGPYKGDGQKYFDKAVTCDGNTITYHFKVPWPDFPLAIASLHMADPYRQDKDQGAKSNYMIFSNGPYMIKGSDMWDKNSGAVFVRNPNYDPKTDSTDIRKALPDEIDFSIGQTPETIYDRLIADSGQDQFAVTSSRVPPAYYTQVTGPVADRSDLVKSPYVDYLAPNFPNMPDLKVREALNVATNKQAWIDAGGGSKAYAPAYSVIASNLPGYQPNPAFQGPQQGDPAAAKKLLEQAGVKIPYPITFTYETSDTFDKQAAALKDSWDKAGFDVTLDGLGSTYFDIIEKPVKTTDVMWTDWGADWPSAITVTPQLFDSRIVTKSSTGSNYGSYKSDKFDALIDQARNSTNLDEQTKALQQSDLVLGKDVAYIPLEQQNFYWVYGSKVVDFMTTPASNGNPDLGPIAVAQ